MAMRMFEDDDLDVIANTREDWRNWRASETPVLDAAHTVAEVPLALGLVFRFWAHVIGHGMYEELVVGESPSYGEDDLNFARLVAPMLETRSWHQEALMRGHTFLLGTFLLSANWSVAGPLERWAAIVSWGYLLLDPVLGLAWHIYSPNQSS